MTFTSLWKPQFSILFSILLEYFRYESTRLFPKQVRQSCRGKMSVIFLLHFSDKSSSFNFFRESFCKKERIWSIILDEWRCWKKILKFFSSCKRDENQDASFCLCGKEVWLSILTIWKPGLTRIFSLSCSRSRSRSLRTLYRIQFISINNACLPEFYCRQRQRLLYH